MFKHSVLFSVLQIAARSQEKWLYLETHAATGTYDLTGKQSLKTNEAAQGVLPMLDHEAPCPEMVDWLAFVQSRGPEAYPGSPAIAQHCFRPQDRMIFFERHPAEYKKLQAALASDNRTRALEEDGYQGALTLQPRRGENMLVFLDPSYETERDMDALGNWLPRAMKRWPKATFLVWLPLFRDERELEFGQYVASLDYGFVAGTRWTEFSTKESALEGSAIIGLRTTPAMARPAYQIGEALEALWA
ncbi:23S rRNA (adenine(2030)-N(6))-methyltransferase RlmJ [Henriciella sp. AS95]|uniref:23S rRNA (adenine(2030)-N(6))-methyltransferase RlmJ n=1 Tax=Henriciella sp. AS95 TaxID=3135782 RepID=UPI003177570E